MWPLSLVGRTGSGGGFSDFSEDSKSFLDGTSWCEWVGGVDVTEERWRQGKYRIVCPNFSSTVGGRKRFRSLCIKTVKLNFYKRLLLKTCTVLLVSLVGLIRLDFTFSHHRTKQRLRISDPVPSWSLLPSSYNYGNRYTPLLKCLGILKSEPRDWPLVPSPDSLQRLL